MTAAPVSMSRWLVPLSVSCILLVVAHYAYIATPFLVNAPDSDDYVDILWFFEIFRNAGLVGKVQALFLPVHEHITVFSHLVYVLDVSLFGQINFIHYMIVGWCIIAAICVTTAAASTLPLPFTARLALAVVIYASLSYWHSSFWAMTALSNQAVILFAVLAAYSYQRSPDRSAWPIVFALCGCFSQANGLAILVALYVAIATREHTHWRQQMQLPSSWILASLAAAMLLFDLWYQSPFAYLHHLDHQALVTEPGQIHLYQRDISSTGSLSYSIAAAFASIVLLSGPVFSSHGQSVCALLSGSILLAYWMRTLYRRQPLNHFTRVMLVFTLLSIALVAFGRAAMGWEQIVFQPRYRMYSLMLTLLTVYHALGQHPARLAHLLFVFIVGLLLQAGSGYDTSAMRARYQSLTQSYHDWLVDGGMGRATLSIYPPNQDHRLSLAYDSGLYNPVSAIDTKYRPHTVVPDATDTHCNTTPVTGSITAYSKKPKARAVELDIQVQDSRWQPHDPAQLYLCAPEGNFRIILDARNVNETLAQYWPILLLKSELPPATYSVRLQQGDLDGYLGDISFK